MVSFKLSHILNPVIVRESSDLFVAQPVTFESMRLSKKLSMGDIDIDVFSAQFPEDINIIPAWINKTKHLDRSVLDIKNFQKNRKLPLIKDILDRLYHISDAEYFIYTNVDIALMPHFYMAVAQLIKSGIDAMVINRRTINKCPSDISQIPFMWSQVGKRHSGYDCFIFKRIAYTQYNLGNACIGANWIGKILLSNLYVHSKNFKIFKDLHLTFHLGDDRSWKTPEYFAYDEHNKNELRKILYKFEEDGKLKGKPLLNGFLKQIEGEKNPNKIAFLKQWLSNFF